ncbi:hypothetical protein [Lentzea sp. NPDC003310]|uniref:hypothetical protein n=1 Tax=Lentzea sp. NPDC003310 TaxID=3154447 RepID=UPI0033BEEF89
MLQYLEPRTDVPAKDDWSTRLELIDVRAGRAHRIETLVVVVTFAATFFLPDAPGNTAARIVLGFLLVMTLGTLLPNRSVWRALRRGLFELPWRRVSATVAEKQENDPADRLLLDDGVVLKSSLASYDDLVNVVGERHEVFVLGPDEEGRGLVRAAGSTSMWAATVDEGEYRPAERVERAFGRPADDGRVRGDAGLMRSMGYYVIAVAVVTLAVVAVLVSLSLSPLAPAGLVAAAVVAPSLLTVPATLEAFRLNREQAEVVAQAGEWTRVPVALFPWQRGHHVAGIAELPDGPALVRFPRPHYNLIANIAATGEMWVAGERGDRLTVGLPGIGGLTTAVVLPGRAGERSDPLSWWRRYRQSDFSDLPR